MAHWHTFCVRDTIKQHNIGAVAHNMITKMDSIANGMCPPVKQGFEPSMYQCCRQRRVESLHASTANVACSLTLVVMPLLLGSAGQFSTLMAVYSTCVNISRQTVHTPCHFDKLCCLALALRNIKFPE